MTYPISEPHADIVRLRELADSRPSAIALRHKQQGAWYFWRWLDVADEVRDLAQGLQALGFAAGDGLAVSGDIGPHLLLIGLAARHLGGRLIAVPPDADGREIAATLRTHGIRHAFTQGRQNLTAWLQASAEAGIDLRVIFDHATADGKTPESGAITFDALRGPGGAAERLEPSAEENVARRHITSRRGDNVASGLFWVEENTRWQSGLDVLLRQWLNDALTLAFPESLAAAARDRREVEPRRLLVSVDRLDSLYEDILHRLPPDATRLRRLIDRSIHSGGAFRGRWHDRVIAWLVRRPLGLRRLREIAVFAVSPGTAAEVSAPVRKLFAGLAVFLAPQIGAERISAAESGVAERLDLPAEIRAPSAATGLTALANG